MLRHRAILGFGTELGRQAMTKLTKTPRLRNEMIPKETANLFTHREIIVERFGMYVLLQNPRLLTLERNVGQTIVGPFTESHFFDRWLAMRTSPLDRDYVFARRTISIEKDKLIDYCIHRGIDLDWRCGYFLIGV